ncbi:MAG TPA: POTRA domain-containing protein [Kofleriaceae bacterium]|nr:POTRA domain-containing protein [Kofleriaceae bacterium]
MKRALVLMLVVASAPALAQAPRAPAPAQSPTQPPPATEEDTLTTQPKFDEAACLQLDLTPGAVLQEPPPPGELAPPIPWSEFDIQGQLIDRKKTVMALLDPTMQQLRTSLSRATLPQVAGVLARFGYQLIGHVTKDIPNGTQLVLYVAPLPLVKKVKVKVRFDWRRTFSFSGSLFDKQLGDDIVRRMSFRSGSYLPWDPPPTDVRRRCALIEEKRRIEEFLFDEGYFAASVDIEPEFAGSTATVKVDVRLQNWFQLGTITVACPAGYVRPKNSSTCVDPTTNTAFALAMPEADIKAMFVHERCLVGSYGCFLGPARFTRAQYQADLQKLKEKFQHDYNYPGVRITSSELAASIDRKHGRVNPVLTIEQRRQVFVDFTGQDSDRVSDSQLRDQLTFYDAGAADDVEAAESARALTTYLQTRGFFDARVTWTRERVDIEPRPGTRDTGTHFDKITFVIDAKDTRRVQSVQFVGNHELKSDKLAELVATKEARLANTFLGTTASPTSVELIADQERIKEAYRRAGYPDARVGTSASPVGSSLDNAALTAALLGTDRDNNLFVRFTIDEGPPTLLSRVIVQLDGGGQPDPALCAESLGALAKLLDSPQIALQTDKDKCAVTVSDLKFRADDVAAARDQLRDALFKIGRARARVEYAAVPIGPSRVEARYTIKHVDKLKLGTVVIRGNFRTTNTVIYDALDFDEGDLLTTDRLAEGARRLRNMGLFETVNLDMPDLDCDQDRQCSSEVINAVVRVEERYPHTAEIALEGGFSSQNGFFGTIRPTAYNILGRGMRFDVTLTLGQRLTEVDARYRIPPYLMRPFDWHLDFTTDFTALYRVQDTDRFGVLETRGFGVALSRAFWVRPRTDKHSARAFTIGPYYDFHVRSHNVDATRPIGANMDENQVAISTRTGAIGVHFEFENRVDRNGALSPLAPEKGAHAELSASYATPYLGGQDKFLKFSASASKFETFAKYINVRADARYDQGIPFGGVQLLPDVERFFAGGDNTVRGYADDRMATEIIQVGVPPFDNVTQIRVLPASRNIRVLASLDAQARIWKILAGALFTDAGLLTNQWSSATTDDIRPSVGMGLRALTPFGIGALEYAVPLRPQLGDDPRGRIHFYFAARAQF